jgi:hypothetical protein
LVEPLIGKKSGEIAVMQPSCLRAAHGYLATINCLEILPTLLVMNKMIHFVIRGEFLLKMLTSTLVTTLSHTCSGIKRQ